MAEFGISICASLADSSKDARKSFDESEGFFFLASIKRSRFWYIFAFESLLLLVELDLILPYRFEF